MAPFQSDVVPACPAHLFQLSPWTLRQMRPETVVVELVLKFEVLEKKPNNVLAAISRMATGRRKLFNDNSI